MLREVGGGWRIYSQPEYAAAVERFVLDGAQITQPCLLETLAIIATDSRSPAAGLAPCAVSTSTALCAPFSRGLIEETGAESETGAVLYGTTGCFLERLGLRDLGELPALAPYLPAVETLDDLAEAGRVTPLPARNGGNDARGGAAASGRWPGWRTASWRSRRGWGLRTRGLRRIARLHRWSGRWLVRSRGRRRRFGEVAVAAAGPSAAPRPGSGSRAA